MLINQRKVTKQARSIDVVKRKILAISVIYYPLVILNIILTVMLLNVGEKLYVALFWVLFGIDKIIIGIISFQNQSVEACAFCMLDFLQIGCVSVQKDMNFTPSQGDIYLITKLHSFILPWTFVQSVLIFGGRVIDHGNELESVYQILVYISFILLVLVGSMGMSLISSMQSTSSFKSIIILFSSYTTQCSLFSIVDNNGIKIGVYTIILLISTLLIQYYYIPKIFTMSKIQRIFIYSIFMIPFQWSTDDFLAYNRSIYISYYFNQFIRTILLISIGSIQITDVLNYKSTLSINNQLMVVNFVLASIFGIISLLIQIKDILNCIFNQKIIVIDSHNSLKKASKSLSRSNLKFESLEIYYLHGSNYQNEILQQGQENKLMNRICTNPEDCRIYIEMLMSISFLVQKNIDIKSYSCPNMCYEHFKTLLMKIESFSPNTLKALKKHISVHGIKNTFEIIFERYFNGLGMNHNKISRCLQNIISPSQLNKLKILIYERNIKHLMIMNPQIVLYDLIQDLDINLIKTPRVVRAL